MSRIESAGTERRTCTPARGMQLRMRRGNRYQTAGDRRPIECRRIQHESSSGRPSTGNGRIAFIARASAREPFNRRIQSRSTASAFHDPLRLGTRSLPTVGAQARSVRDGLAVGLSLGSRPVDQAESQAKRPTVAPSAVNSAETGELGRPRPTTSNSEPCWSTAPGVAAGSCRRLSPRRSRGLRVAVGKAQERPLLAGPGLRVAPTAGRRTPRSIRTAAIAAWTAR